jgi:circadian clock protein KaiB
MAETQKQPDETDALTAAFEKAITDGAHVNYVLHLYVTGMRPCSQRAIDNIRRLCEEHLSGRYKLKVIDVYQQPELAKGAQIIAAPTLVRELPPPLRKIVGDMSDEGRVLIALGVEVAAETEEPAE